MSIIFGISIDMFNVVYAKGPEDSLGWSIKTSKRTFYPGEPVLLTLKVRNTGKGEESIYFGGGGIGAFSMEIRDGSNKIVAQGGKIGRGGITSRGPIKVPPGQIGQRSIVLNQWCSTILPIGQYHIICRVEPYLLPNVANPNVTVKALRLPVVVLELDIQVAKMDNSKFKQILADLAKRAFKTNLKTREEFSVREIAREMLTFTESDLAVSYQLEVLRIEPSTRLRRDVINSLARSGTLEAANGLLQTIIENEDCLERIEDIKWHVIDAVYRLRETGKADIINATDEFVSKYKRPVPVMIID